MTIAEQFRQEGYNEAILIAEQKAREHIEKGKAEALKTVATNLFGQGMAVEQIAMITGLSVFELGKLKSNTSRVY